MIQCFTVILPAAGASRRYGRNKLLEPLAGKPILFHTLSAYLSRPDVARIILATGHDFSQDAHIAPLLKDPRIKICSGGSCRAESVRAAVLASDPNIPWLAIHDAARPLISQGLIDRTFALARDKGCAVPAMPVSLTIKLAASPLPSPVRQTLPRHELWAMQTPQIMRRTDLLAAYENCPLPLDQITDDAQLIELAGQPVWLLQGEERNLKITTPVDLVLAESYLREIR